MKDIKKYILWFLGLSLLNYILGIFGYCVVPDYNDISGGFENVCENSPSVFYFPAIITLLIWATPKLKKLESKFSFSSKGADESVSENENVNEGEEKELVVSQKTKDNKLFHGKKDLFKFLIFATIATTIFLIFVFLNS